MKKTNDLGNDSILSLVLRLAIPAMLAQLVNVLYTAVDRIFIGNIPAVGDIALAGIGVCAPIAEFISSWGNLLGVGGSVYMAMKMGAKENEEAEKILSNSFQGMLVMSVVLTVVFLLAKEHLIWWFGASSETFAYANQYLTIYISGCTFAVLALGMNYFLSCQGLPAVAMLSVFIGAFTNIILDYVLVMRCGFGVAGAAFATVFAQFCSCTWTLLYLFGKKVHIRIRKHAVSFKRIITICKLGLSPFIMYSTNSVIVIVLNIVLQKHGGPMMGDKLITAAAIVQSYVIAIFNPLGGITAGTQAVISYNYGAKNYRRVIKALNQITGVAVVFTSVMFVVSRIVPQYVAMMFTQDPEIIALSVFGMKAFTIGLVPMALHYEATDGLTALGRGSTALIMSAFRKITFVVLMCIIPMFAEAKFTFAYEPVGDIVCGLINTVACIFIVRKMLNTKELYKKA